MRGQTVIFALLGFLLFILLVFEWFLEVPCSLSGSEESEERGALPLVSLRLGHDTALIAVGEDSLPCRRFATPASPF